MESRKVFAEPGCPGVIQAWPKTKTEGSPHPADQHVGRQIAIVRLQSDVSQAQLARSIGVSFQQLQKYENAKNRVSASMLYEIASSLAVPVSRFFGGLPGNEIDRDVPTLPVDERIDFIASAEGRRLIEGLVQLHPRVRGRVSALIVALGEELAVVDPKQESGTSAEPTPVEGRLA
ncbi:transcriptional regulator [Mesorhizobium sp. LSJC285A00]|uniref:helix-turn-helix domain-containing protein n=1 Tax=unclassified Mesorhizobium TaxID=325217 RepID=UPI0003CF30C5|nr:MULTISPECIES: helix-turn-helix domain-containing protein [unclassified Mesorhizobium]ESW65097.1 transcriptional regulator [Mesorhizobium sp. LSJC285A00]ESW84422.1 transcriptional regulator [Mesorhizobium sp. LSJC269B00]